MKKQPIHILTDLPRLDGLKTFKYSAHATSTSRPDTFWEGVKLFFRARKYDVVLLNSNTKRVFAICALKWLMPGRKCCLVVVDIHLTAPNTWMERLVAWGKRLVLKKVDHFVHYFRDFSKYDRYYGIGVRSSYVPFKVNYWEKIFAEDRCTSDGQYVFTAGRSFRDIPTYVEALRRIPYPGMFLWEADSVMKEFGAGFGWSDLPKNLHLEPHDGHKSWIDYIKNAKVVVVPILPEALYAPGLSLYPMAMALNKCVIITEGAATIGILKGDEAIIIPAGDAAAMADAIQKAWENDELRERVAAVGKKYAQMLQGELRLMHDLVDVGGDLVFKRRC